MTGTQRQFDTLLFCAALGLLGLGLVIVYSATAITAVSQMGDEFAFLKKHLLAAGLGIIALLIAYQIPHRFYIKSAYILLLGTALLLFLVLFIGQRKNGSTRWFNLGFFSFQPGELAKLALVLYLAYSLAKKRDHVRTFLVGFLPHVLITGILMLLVLRQPDFGTAVSLGLILFVMLFIAGTKLNYIFLSLGMAIPFAYYMITSTHYRMGRWIAFLDPFKFRKEQGYQLFESYLSFGVGGVTGTGLGAGKQKLFYFPEYHNDFVLSAVAEELGLLGVLAVLILFSVLIWRGIHIALRATTDFGRYLAVGLTAMIGLQAVIHMGVVTGLLPTKGMTLPLVSYGGSSLMITLLAIGILMNIYHKSEEETCAS